MIQIGKRGINPVWKLNHFWLKYNGLPKFYGYFTLWWRPIPIHLRPNTACFSEWFWLEYISALQMFVSVSCLWGHKTCFNIQYYHWCFNFVHPALCCSRKYSHSSHRRFLFCIPTTLRNFSLASYFASIILAFKTPLPLGISIDLPWGGYGFFLELDTLIKKKSTMSLL